MNKITALKITANDLLDGVPDSRERCPIALAAKRAFGIDHPTFGPDDDGYWVLSLGAERYEVVGGSAFAQAFDEMEFEDNGEWKYDHSVLVPCELPIRWIRYEDEDEDEDEDDDAP